jgi:kynurenine formamidase
MTYIDLTRTFADNMPVFPGDPPVRLKPVASIATHGYNNYEIASGMHAGTHIDAPLHMLPGGQCIADIPVSGFIGRGRLIDARGAGGAGAELLASAAIEPGDIVLVLTGFSDRFGEASYFTEYPEISETLAAGLADRGVRMLGLDTPSPDREPYRVHKLLLARGILIIENLTNLAALLDVGAFEVIALPVRFQADAAPARVIARVIA